MLNDSKRIRCPKDKTHSTFTATAHCTELWEVDDEAEYIEVIESLETTHRPAEGDLFTCSKCNTQAVVITLTQPRKCDDCGQMWDKSELDPIDKLNDRVDEGGIMPSGQCPGCGALCYVPKGHKVENEP